MVTGPDGQRHFIEREPLEGIKNWARGQNIIIDEFVFKARIHSKSDATIQRVSVERAIVERVRK